MCSAFQSNTILFILLLNSDIVCSYRHMKLYIFGILYLLSVDSLVSFFAFYQSECIRRQTNSKELQISSNRCFWILILFIITENIGLMRPNDNIFLCFSIQSVAIFCIFISLGINTSIPNRGNVKMYVNGMQKLDYEFFVYIRVVDKCV